MLNLTTARGARLLVLSLAFAASVASAESPIRIGWLSSLTGPLSSAAIAENQGVQFAVDEINASGGVDGRKLELITRDTSGEPTKAVNLAKQLAFVDKVDFIIGPVNSGESLATVPIVAKAGIPNLIIGTIDELVDAQKFPLAFRAINTNRQWIEAANDYALNVLRKKKIAVIGDTSGYGTASSKVAENLLEKAGVKPVYLALVDPNKTDLTDELNKARAAGAEVIMPWSAATGLLAGINAAKLLGGEPTVTPPATTALGALLHYITDPERKRFQPMNVNFGLIAPLTARLRGRAKKEMMSRRALADLAAWARENAVAPAEKKLELVAWR